MMEAEHQCFTVSDTAYLRNIDLKSRCVAVHYQKPPTITDNGQSIGLRFPFLILAEYIEDADKVAEKVARILNAHWDDEGSDA